MSDFPDYHVGSRSVAVPSESVEGIDATQTGTVASGDMEVVYVRPPSGYLYELLGLMVTIQPVSNATTDVHEFHLCSEKKTVEFLKGQSFYDDMIVFDESDWSWATSEQEPATSAGQTLASRNYRASEDNAFELTYENHTDADQIDDRVYKLTVRKIRVL